MQNQALLEYAARRRWMMAVRVREANSGGNASNFYYLNCDPEVHLQDGLSRFSNDHIQNQGRIEVHIVTPDADQIAARIGGEHLKSARVVTIHKGKFEDFISYLAQDAAEIMKRRIYRAWRTDGSRF